MPTWDDLDCDDRIKHFLKSVGVRPGKAQELMELIATVESEEVQLEDGLEEWLLRHGLSATTLDTLVDEVGLQSWADLDELTDDVLASASLKPLQRSAIKRALKVYQSACEDFPALKFFNGFDLDELVEAGNKATAAKAFVLLLEFKNYPLDPRSRRVQVYDVRTATSRTPDFLVEFERRELADEWWEYSTKATGLGKWLRDNASRLTEGSFFRDSFSVYKEYKCGEYFSVEHFDDPLKAVLWYP